MNRHPVAPGLLGSIHRRIRAVEQDRRQLALVAVGAIDLSESKSEQVPAVKQPAELVFDRRTLDFILWQNSDRFAKIIMSSG